jgi:hypothetical protein
VFRLSIPTDKRSLLQTRDDGRRFMHSDEKLSAFVELERQLLTVTFYLDSIHTNSARGELTADVNCLAELY